MQRIHSLAVAVLLALANGFLLFFYSERLWFGAPRPGDTVQEYLYTWLAYVLAGYLFLAFLHWLRVRSLAALFIVGAIFGWLIEGVIAGTLYGASGIPFPLTIVITAVSWHSLVTVLVGWYAARRTLDGAVVWHNLALWAALGVLWGLWTPFEWNETPPIVPAPLEFAQHAFIMASILALAYWMLDRFNLAAFRPSRVAAALVVALFAVAFFFVDVLPLGWLPLVVLPCLLAAAFALLYFDRRAGSGPDLLTRLYASHVPARRFLFVLVMPATATAVYALAWSVRDQWWHVDQAFFVLSALLGLVGLVWCTFVIVRNARRAAKTLA